MPLLILTSSAVNWNIATSTCTKLSIADPRKNQTKMAQNGNGGSEMDQINTHIVTLTRFLTEEQAKHKEATGDFTCVYPLISSRNRRLTGV